MNLQQLLAEAEARRQAGYRKADELTEAFIADGLRRLGWVHTDVPIPDAPQGPQGPPVPAAPTRAAMTPEEAIAAGKAIAARKSGRPLPDAAEQARLDALPPAEFPDNNHEIPPITRKQ